MKITHTITTQEGQNPIESVSVMIDTDLNIYGVQDAINQLEMAYEIPLVRQALEKAGYVLTNSVNQSKSCEPESVALEDQQKSLHPDEGHGIHPSQNATQKFPEAATPES